LAEAVRISELFLSLQGEGPSAGTPACFVRLQGCDVGCVWCDTKYSWDAAGGQELALTDLWPALDKLGSAPLLVVTGGEPLQLPGLGALLDGAVERWPRVEVETSGVAAPLRSHSRLFYNVSPKLPSATPRWQETWAHAPAWKAEPHATFKLVVGTSADWDDARRLIAEHDLPRARVMLMPEGMTDAVLRERAAWLAAVCAEQGLRLSPRLHVWLWGARRGK
jgi:7-carboxy-7-deazaguanine synthase